MCCKNLHLEETSIGCSQVLTVRLEVNYALGLGIYFLPRLLRLFTVRESATATTTSCYTLLIKRH